MRLQAPTIWTCGTGQVIKETTKEFYRKGECDDIQISRIYPAVKKLDQMYPLKLVATVENPFVFSFSQILRLTIC